MIHTLSVYCKLQFYFLDARSAALFVTMAHLAKYYGQATNQLIRLLG